MTVNAVAPGWLVLADVWYPGWTCTVDGQPVDVLRADYVFRAVAIPAGEHRLTFTFAPRSYAIGRTATFAALATCLVLVAGLFALRRR